MEGLLLYITSMDVSIFYISLLIPIHFFYIHQLLFSAPPYLYFVETDIEG